MIKVERIAISLPKGLNRRVEELRHRMGFNRSVFFQIVLRSFLDSFPEKEDKRLARLYQEIQQTDKELLHHFRRESYKHLQPYEK